MKTSVIAVMIASAILCPVEGLADTQVFGIVIGNNEPPVGHSETLKKLRYADDDAVRYYRFISQMAASNHIALLTVPDVDTQKRFGGIGNTALLPTLSNLQMTISRMARSIASAREGGDRTVVFFVFSGHGALDDEGKSFLALSDGAITGALLNDQILGVLQADYYHLIVDACHAGGVVSSRGMFDREQDAVHEPVSTGEIDRLKENVLQQQFAGLGILVASSAQEESHEWSEIESGVFTHQVLSGLTGAADVNLDGRIEYSELAAFVASANRSVTDPRGRIHLIAKPPRRNVNIALVDYSKMSHVSFLHGSPGGLGHFHIELKNGLRFMDANLATMEKAYVAVPSEEVLYLRTDQQEAMFVSDGALSGRFGDLAFQSRQVAPRGAIDATLRDGLFRSPYDRAYYQGYVDREGQPGVRFDGLELPILADKGPAPVAVPSDASERWRRSLAISLFVTTGAAVMTSAVIGALALKTRNDYEDTAWQKESAQLNDRYQRLGTAFWVSAAAIPVFAIAGALMLPRKKAKTVSMQAGSDLRDAVALEVRFVF